MLDGDALERLSESISTAATHITFAIFTAMEAMQGTAPAFVAQARQRYRIAGKRLALQLEEFEATIKTFQTCLQHSFTDDGALEFILESVGSTNHLIDHVVPLSSTSIVIAPCGIDPLLRLDKASRVSVIGIDLNHVLVSHARWLARGEYNDVFITLVADNGEPVLGLSPADIVCTLDSGARGWAVTSVSISSHTVSIGLSLALDCADVAALQVEVGDAAKTVSLKVCTSFALPSLHTSVC